ncbi:PLD-like domain [Alkalibacterium subtropicum]|uniref:PLD-like domain n=1 Tax=Alkalibacterium subtropicum TaxID=753702 RepID=A0A1I1FT62_9LACT|nr:restriction endonuclease PLD domain-containing protein [Alkalibacterium subtropicum]SFC00160.1 PLD-like domain [Alkalibacterium subtropicum]
MHWEELAIILNDLYNSIIMNNSKSHSKLRVITGYASPIFLRRVKRDFPELAVELYIGMAREGISQKSHQQFLEISDTYSNVNVYYQVKGVPTHRKLLEFYSNVSRKVYVGSANFTENGFLRQNELMINIHYNPSQLFLEQNNVSLNCNHENITDYIKLIEDESLKEDNEYVVDNKETENIIKEELKTGINHKVSYSEKIDFNASFEIEAVLDPHHNRHWETTGLNAWMNNRSPYIMQTPKLFFDTIFPVGVRFKIITKEFVFEAELQGDFNKELVITNGNIYEYVREKINLKERRPISKDDLINYGNTKFRFTKINDYLFKMTF